MSTKHTLSAEPRTITGRKVKQLRRQEILPANLFGTKIDSISLQLPLKDFLTLYHEVGDTGLIDFQIKGEKKTRPIMVHKLQTDPVTDQLIHADLRQVDLKQKTTAEVPIEQTGESDAVHQGGILVTLLDSVEIEALPTDLPDKLQIDLSALKEIGSSLHLTDIKIDTAKLTFTAEPDTVVVKVDAPKTKEQEDAETAAAASTTTETETGTEEGTSTEETKDKEASSEKSDQPSSDDKTSEASKE